MRLYVWLLAAVLVFASGAWAGEDELSPDDLVIAAFNTHGYIMAMSWVEYSPERIEAHDPDVHYGWTTFGSGEPLNLELGGPLSAEDYDPLAPVSCGEGVDPAAMAALVGSQVAVRYPGPLSRCPFPIHPSGEFISAELPGPCLVILRLPEGVTPHEAYAEWRGDRYPLAPVSAVQVARWMLEGETPTPAEDSEPWLEDLVTEIDLRTVIAAADGDTAARPQLLADAVLVIEACLQKYYLSHGQYPEMLSDLITVPGAVVARLPFNPYYPSKQLSLERTMAGSPPLTVVYLPLPVETPDGVRNTSCILHILGQDPAAVHPIRSVSNNNTTTDGG